MGDYEEKMLKSQSGGRGCFMSGGLFYVCSRGGRGEPLGLHHGEGRRRKHYDSFFRSVGDASGFLVRKLCHEYQLRFVDFFHIDSRDLWTQELGYANGGNLFSICYTQTLDYLDLPSFETLGNGADGIYYATTPTDVQGYYDNDQVMAEFTDMSDDVQWVLDNIQINGSSGSTVEISSSSDYILPQSSTEYLDESDLTGMSADQVQMAINEIYARHHRKFVLQDVQAYFDSKSWYDGYVEADEFDTRVMNQYEAANINLMVEYMEKIS